MISITFKVAPDGGDPYEVNAGTRDLLLWERTTKGKTTTTLMNELAMTDLYKLAWLASKRTNQFADTLQVFEDTCDLDFDVDQELDPTRPARPTGP